MDLSKLKQPKVYAVEWAVSLEKKIETIGRNLKLTNERFVDTIILTF